MPWHPSGLTERLPEVLRLICGGLWLLSAITVSAFSLYIVFRACQQIVEALERWVFLLDK